MRALVSWDISASDPSFPSIILAIADCFPPQMLEPMTNHTARANGITKKQFVEVNDRLKQVATLYAGRMFYVFSLHAENDPIYAVPRPTVPGPTVVAVTPGGG